MTDPSQARIDAYRDALLALLPPGRALTRVLGRGIPKLLEAAAVEPARIHERTLALLDESDPSTATELLPEWEALLGLPDGCASPTSLPERRASVVGRLVGTGGHSQPDYEALAATLGYPSVTFTHYAPFTAGHGTAGAALTNDPWANYVLATTASGPNDDVLACTFSRQPRAHGKVDVTFVSGGWTPAALSPLHWLDSADAATLSLSGSAVAAWSDKGTAGGSWVQSTPANRPNYSASDLGYPGVRCVPHQYVDRAAPTSPSAFHFFFVMRQSADPPTAGTGAGAWNMTSAPQADNTHVPYSDGVIYDSSGTTSRKTSVNPATSLSAGNVVYEVVSTATEWTNFLNWTQLYTTASNTPSWGGTLRLGSNEVASISFDGVFREVLIFTSKLSAPDRSSVQSYLASKWGTP